MFNSLVNILSRHDNIKSFCDRIEGVDLSQFPDDIFIAIFGQLDIQSQNAFGNTCKRLRGIANSNIVWQNNIKTYFSSAPSEHPSLEPKAHFFQLLPLEIIYSEHAQQTNLGSIFATQTGEHSFSNSILTRDQIIKEIPVTVQKVVEKRIEMASPESDKVARIFLCYIDKDNVPDTRGQISHIYKLWVNYAIPKG